MPVMGGAGAQHPAAEHAGLQFQVSSFDFVG
jgi:hypothetical protein